MIKYTLPFLFFSIYALDFNPDKIISHRFKSHALQEPMVYIPNHQAITTQRFRSAMLPVTLSAPVTPVNREYTVGVKTSQTSHNSYTPVNVNVTDITVGYVRNCYKLDKYLVFPCEKIFYSLTCGAILLLQFDTGYESIFKYASLISGIFAYTFNQIHDIINKKIKKADAYLYDVGINHEPSN